MRHTARIAVCCLGLLLSGCASHQKQQLNACTLHAQSDGEIVQCMAQHGYHAVFANKRCKNAYIPAREALCYRPDGMFEALIFRLQHMFGKM